MKTDKAKVVCWVRAPSDARGWAGYVASAELPKSKAFRVAKQIDALGNAGAGDFLPLFNLAADHRLASGHGVLVAYASGQKRYVREDE